MTSIIGRGLPVLMGKSFEVCSKKSRFSSSGKDLIEPLGEQDLKTIFTAAKYISIAGGMVGVLPGAIYGGREMMQSAVKDKDPFYVAIAKSTYGAAAGGCIGYYLGRAFPITIPAALYWVYLTKIKAKE